MLKSYLQTLKFLILLITCYGKGVDLIGGSYPLAQHPALLGKLPGLRRFPVDLDTLFG
jgi:hypothetical protein